MSQPTLDPTSSEAQIPSINLQAATPPASSAPGDTLVSLIRKEYRNLTQILPEIDVSEKDRETCSSKLERYKGSFAPDTDEYQSLLFFDSTSDVAELLANIVDIEKLIKAVSTVVGCFDQQYLWYSTSFALRSKLTGQELRTNDSRGRGRGH
jgi:hypothetical protein